MEAEVGDTGRPARTRLWRRLLLLCVSLVVALLILEAGGRLYAHLAGLRRGVGYSERLGWSMIPGVEKSDAEWCERLPATVNALGWRDAEHPRRKPAGMVRTVALGDSFVFGQGVDYGDRFTERLEAAQPGLEVINMGVCGYGPDQQLLAFRDQGRRFEPDVVLHFVCLFNDLEDIAHARRHAWPKPYFLLEEGALDLVPPERSWDVPLREHSYLAEFLFQKLRRGTMQDRRAEAWQGRDTTQLFLAIEQELAREAERAGAAFLAVLIGGEPLRRDEEPARRHPLVAQLEELGIPVVVCEEAFRGHEGAWSELLLPCGHWSPLGHRLVAELLQAEIGRRGWLDP